MRYAIAVVFAVVVTVAMFTLPLWVVGNNANAFTPGADLAPVNRMIADLRSHNYADARALIGATPTPPRDAQLDQMPAAIPKTGQAAVNVTHWIYASSAAAGTQTSLEVYYDYGAGGATVTQATLVSQGGKQKL